MKRITLNIQKTSLIKVVLCYSILSSFTFSCYADGSTATNSTAVPEQKTINTQQHKSTTSSRIIFDKNFPKNKRADIKNWVDHAAQALRLVYGKLPVNNFVTVVKTSNRGTSVVPWGEVNRHSPPEVLLVVNPRSSLKALKADWTIYHEFSHLLIPFDAGDSRWFSEGLASYYQNITQARIGMFNEQTMWQKLYNGFERGNKQQNYRHQTLDYVSDNIASNRNYMRIYWSGALYWLQADIALRKQAKITNKPYSLDIALKQLQSCCFDTYLNTPEIVEKLDELSQSNIFSSLLTKFSGSYAIPNYLQLLNDLGVEVKSSQVRLKSRAPLSNLRADIYSGVIKNKTN